MRKVIYQTQLTLDGFVAGPNGELDWLVEHALSEDGLQALQVEFFKGGIL